MAAPTREQLEIWAEGYAALWNAGDKQAWIANWKAVAPGDFQMLDPVGTPPRRGFQTCCADAWDMFQPLMRLEVAEGTRFICGNEVAWLMRNHTVVDGEAHVMLSIDNYRFGDDGSVEVRTWYDPPTDADDEIGDVFRTYLPRS